MTNVLASLLALLVFLTGPATKGNVATWHSTVAAKGGTRSLQPMADAAFRTGTIRNVAGYELGGNAGLVGTGRLSRTSKGYWSANGPAEGSSLHHWLFPQSTTWVPQGIRNAGFNLMELPPIVETPFGGLNQWMGMSHSPWAPVVEWGFRIGVPASIGGAAYGGAQIGNTLLGDPSIDR